MAKFRKSIKIAPGVKINLSKSGVSTTFGGKGASVNIGKNGAYLNTGIPGTGIYDRQKISGGKRESTDNAGEESGGYAPPPSMGKTAKRVFFVLFLIFAGLTISSIIRGHPFWAFIQGFIGFVMLLTPPINNMMAKS
jgi:hypothetical protein